MKTDKQNKREKISTLLEGIDEKYTSEALEAKRKRSFLPKIAAVAACVALAVTATAAIIPVMNRSSSNVITETASATQASTDAAMPTESTEAEVHPDLLSGARPYKSGVGSTAELAYGWLWEDMTPMERYTSFSFNGMEYFTRASVIAANKLGDNLGSAVFKGYDNITGTEYTESFDIYEISGVSAEYLLTAELEGEFVIFINLNQSAPETLGELMEAFDLSNALSFERFSLNESYEPKENYVITNGSEIWDILNKHADSSLCPEDVPDFTGKEYISFTSTSETLGIYKKYFTVTSDGYVDTNICEYGCTYYIGEAAAKEIFDYCLDNSEKAEAEPYMYYIYGYVTEVGDGYFLIDDSEVCSDPDNGLIFKVKTDDIRVGRYVKHGIVKEGSFISVDFRGEITDELEIENVQYISKAYFHGGDIVVLE